jgi:4-amino-4-deoxy-L-arabinose transferase-like glycosyltransferase
MGALLLRLWLRGSFDGLYGQDAYAYYDFAHELRAFVLAGKAPGPFFWPLGYPALLATATTLFGTNPTTAQAVSIVMGALLPALVYLLARQLGGGRFGGLVAGALMSVCGQAIQSSLVVMADIPALFWITLSGVLLWHDVASAPWHKHGALVTSAVIFTLAVLTRWLNLVLALPWTLAVLLPRRLRWQSATLAVLGAAIVFLPQIIYSRTNPYPALNHAWVEGWSPANLFQNEFTNIDGHFVYQQVNAVFYAQVFYDPYYLWPIFMPLMLIGIWMLWRRRANPQLAFLLGWALLPYFFLAGIPYQNIRFPLIVFPAVALLVGFGFEWITHSISSLISVKHAHAILTLLLIWGAIGTLAQAADTLHTFIANQERCVYLRPDVDSATLYPPPYP